MNCPHCASSEVSKNGHKNHRQNYRCKVCGRQFLDQYQQRGYSEEVRNICLKMHMNGMKYREIERMTGISHNTIILWVRQAKAEQKDQDSSSSKLKDSQGGEGSS